MHNFSLIFQVVSEILILKWTLVGPVFCLSRQLHIFLMTSGLYNFSYITARGLKFLGFV